MSSLSRPARSGPNNTPARRAHAPISRSSAAAPRAVSTGLMMWRGRGQVANTRCRSATASATEANTIAASRIRSAPDELRHAFSCGQPSRGATRRRWNSPPFAMARAQAPMLSASCGRTRMTTGEWAIGTSSAPPSRPVMLIPHAGRRPGIHDFVRSKEGVDAGAKPRHDDASQESSFRVLRLPGLHEGDLLLLRRDDVPRQLPQLRILAVLQLDLCHVDGTLMVRHHTRNEVLVGIAGVGDRHILVHLHHGIAVALGG